MVVDVRSRQLREHRYRLRFVCGFRFNESERFLCKGCLGAAVTEVEIENSLHVGAAMES